MSRCSSGPLLRIRLEITSTLGPSERGGFDSGNAGRSTAEGDAKSERRGLIQQNPLRIGHPEKPKKDGSFS